MCSRVDIPLWGKLIVEMYIYDVGFCSCHSLAPSYSVTVLALSMV